MELRKCKNCGAFISSEDDFCTSCANTLSYNHTILKGFFDGAPTNIDSVSTVSSQTGVSPSIVENYMVANNMIDSSTLEKTSFANLPY